MISLVTVEELPKVVDLAQWFYCRLNPQGEFSRESFLSAWTNILRGGMGFIMKRGDLEAIGVLIYPDPYDGKLAAGTAFWYVAGDDNSLACGMLHRELETALRKHGVSKIFFSNLIHFRYGRVEKFLLHAGYQPVEVHFRKDL